MIVPIGGGVVAALGFETDRAPYVVRNPREGAITFEVPWRDGTNVRSASRSELLRILVPQQTLPHVEVLQAYVRAVPERRPNKAGALDWWGQLDLYVTPMSESLVIPLHRMAIEAAFADGSRLAFNAQAFSSPSAAGGSTTVDELVLLGPGRVVVRAHRELDLEFPVGPLVLHVKLTPAASDLPVALEIPLEFVQPASTEKAHWKLHPGRD